MKKVLLLVFTGLFFCSCNTNPPTSPESISYPAGKIIVQTTINLETIHTASAKVVLLEDFANVSCVPCVTSNKIIESLLNGAYSNKIAVVKFPTNFPSPNDPFYLSNSDVCDARMQYYNIIFAPTLIVDGTLRPTATDSAAVKEKINERLTADAPFYITVDKTFQDSSLIVNINVRPVSLAGINLNDLVLNTIITENDIEFNQAPGSNGEKVFYNVLRKVLPDENGVSFSALPDTTFEWQTDLLSNWNQDNIHVVAYVQNVQTKEVLQTGSDN